MKNGNGKEELSRLLINDSLLPDIFLVRYAHELSKNALLVYLWLNMTGNKENFDENTVKKFKIIPDEEIEKALADLMASGLISRKDKTYYFDESGKMLVGWKRIDGKKYLFKEHITINVRKPY